MNNFIHQFESFNNGELINFLKKNGLGEFSDVMKAKVYDGRTLLNLTEFEMQLWTPKKTKVQLKKFWNFITDFKINPEKYFIEEEEEIYQNHQEERENKEELFKETIKKLVNNEEVINKLKSALEQKGKEILSSDDFDSSDEETYENKKHEMKRQKRRLLTKNPKVSMENKTVVAPKPLISTKPKPKTPAKTIKPPVPKNVFMEVEKNLKVDIKKSQYKNEEDENVMSEYLDVLDEGDQKGMEHLKVEKPPIQINDDKPVLYSPDLSKRNRFGFIASTSPTKTIVPMDVRLKIEQDLKKRLIQNQNRKISREEEVEVDEDDEYDEDGEDYENESPVYSDVQDEEEGFIKVVPKIEMPTINKGGNIKTCKPLPPLPPDLPSTPNKPTLPKPPTSIPDLKVKSPVNIKNSSSPTNISDKIDEDFKKNLIKTLNMRTNAAIKQPQKVLDDKESNEEEAPEYTDIQDDEDVQETPKMVTKIETPTVKIKSDYDDIKRRPLPPLPPELPFTPTKKTSLPRPPNIIPDLGSIGNIKNIEDFNFENSFVSKYSGAKFYRYTNRKGSEELLLKSTVKNGTFLVRPSDKHYCTVSVRYNDRVYQLAIHKGPGTTVLQADIEYDSLETYLEHYKNEPLYLPCKYGYVEVYLTDTLPLNFT